MIPKVYAVRKGRVPGIYENWPACKEQVTGFPGAQFRSFEGEGRYEQAQRYIETGKINAEYENDAEHEQNALMGVDADVYVDGSYSPETKRFAYGVIIIERATGNITILRRGYDYPEMAEMRNVAGEIEGAKAAIEYCIRLGYKKIQLYYDYTGIESWCSGAWRANNVFTQEYKKFYEKKSEEIRVSFEHVKSHTGVEYNEMADEYAKAGLKSTELIIEQLDADGNLIEDISSPPPCASDAGNANEEAAAPEEEKYTRFRDIPQFTRAASYAIDMPINYLVEQIREWEQNEGLVLCPDFQRGHVWTEAQQKAYVEFFLRGGLTGRDIYLNRPSQHTRVKEGEYDEFVCVDGLQRLTAFEKFLDDELAIFGGSYFRDFTDKLGILNTVRVHINDLKTEKEVLTWYVEMNAGGTPHDEEEIARVNKMIAAL